MEQKYSILDFDFDKEKATVKISFVRLSDGLEQTIEGKSADVSVKKMISLQNTLGEIVEELRSI
jgi:hypothetical protein